MKRSSILSLTLCLILSAVSVVAQQYTVTDLGALLPVAVLDGPIVFGNLNGEPVVWQQGQVHALQHHGFGGQVNGANAQGESVGTVMVPSADGSLRRTAAFWDANGSLALLPGSGETEARGLNMHRVIAGANLTTGTGLRWVPGQTVETLPGFPTASQSTAWAVDAVGRAWGSSGHLVIGWDVDGTLHHFIEVGGVQAGARTANHLVAAGFASLGTMTNAAHFHFPPQITHLPNPGPGGRWTCAAAAINSHAATVGSCRSVPPPNVSMAMLWPTPTTMIDLNTANTTAVTLERATGISDDGHIVGITGAQGWLLTPQVTPPSLALQVNQPSFTTGQQLDTQVTLRNPGPARVVDMYLGIIFPDGGVWWIVDLNTLAGASSDSLESDPRTFVPLWRGMGLMAGLHATWAQFVEHLWQGLEPQGTYHLVVGWTAAESLQDGVIDPGDIVALDWKSLTVTGQAVASR